MCVGSVEGESKHPDSLNTARSSQDIFALAPRFCFFLWRLCRSHREGRRHRSRSISFARMMELVRDLWSRNYSDTSGGFEEERESITKHQD